MLTNNIYKMRKPSQDRIIHCLPRPFLLCATPNKQRNFSINTIEASKSISSNLSLCKAIFIGDVAVGKTSLVNRFCHRIFESNYKATIGVDFEVERFTILDVRFNLQIWDTAGQERFKCMAQSYYRGASAIIIVFSLCDPLSLKNSKTWLNEALKMNTFKPIIFLVGTKRDKTSSATYISVENEAIKIANAMKAEYWAVSSKTGDCVNNFFNRLAALTFDHTMQSFLEKSEHIKINDPNTLLRKSSISEPKQYICNGNCK